MRTPCRESLMHVLCGCNAALDGATPQSSVTPHQWSAGCLSTRHVCLHAHAALMVWCCAPKELQHARSALPRPLPPIRTCMSFVRLRAVSRPLSARRCCLAPRCPSGSTRLPAASRCACAQPRTHLPRPLARSPCALLRIWPPVLELQQSAPYWAGHTSRCGCLPVSN